MIRSRMFYLNYYWQLIIIIFIIVDSILTESGTAFIRDCRQICKFATSKSNQDCYRQQRLFYGLRLLPVVSCDFD